MASSPKKKPARSRAEEKAAQQTKREARKEKALRQAEALRLEKAKRKRNERLIIGGIVLAVVVGIAGVFWWQQEQKQERENAAVPANAVDDYALVIGDESAPRTVEIYEDFLCPACAGFEMASADGLAEAAEAGKVQVRYYPFELLGRLGDYSKRSANAFGVVLDASGTEVAKEFHDLLFERQPSESEEFPDDDWLVDLAVEAGAEEADVRDGIEDMTFELWVENANEHAFDQGVQGTPTVLLDGEAFAGTPTELLAEIG